MRARPAGLGTSRVNASCAIPRSSPSLLSAPAQSMGRYLENSRIGARRWQSSGWSGGRSGELSGKGNTTRSFYTSSRRQDVFFVTVPAFKQALLIVTRATLIAVPIAWRWGLFKRFPVASRKLWQIPLLAFCLTVGLGLNQSPKTARWRLLLMTEREEMEWSDKRFEEFISSDGVYIIPPNDPRVDLVRTTCTRLIQALQDDSPVTCAAENSVEVLRKQEKMKRVIPSARTEALSMMPFLPESSNPEKLLPSLSWAIYVVEAPTINAFVLPSTDIFVNSGLLEVVGDDEDLLAAVLAHEICHVTERHSVESLGFLALSGVVFDVLRGASWALTLSFPVVGDGIAFLFTFLDKQVGTRAYSRKLETEADALGLELMAKAGFDPRAALQLWEILNEVEADTQEALGPRERAEQIALLRTHPTGEDRLKAIEALLPSAMKIWKKAKSDALARKAIAEQTAALLERMADEDVLAQMAECE